MTRLARWFQGLQKVKGRKAARSRAYQSEVLAVKMKQVKRKQGKKRR